MKKLYIITALIMALSSCSDDFLDADLLTQQTEEDFYQTPKDGLQALVGCYDGLQQVWAAGVGLPVATAVLSDDCFGGTGASDGFSYQLLDEFDPAKSPSDINIFEQNWIAYYKAIYRCNKFLENMDRIDWGDNEALKQQYTAETKFIRAYCYFDMVRLFGNIPLLEEVSVENVPPADPKDVYALVATDLQYAVDNLSDEAWSESWARSNDGRVTKWAAESLLGRVFLYYTGYFGEASLPTQGGTITKAQALNYVEDVIVNSGQGLVEDYASLWPAASVTDYAGEGNKETVFAVKYTYTSDYDGNTDGNHWMVLYGLRNVNPYPYGQGWGAATVNPELWNLYDDADTRKVASITSIDDEEIEYDPAVQREYTGYFVKKYSPMSNSAGQSVAEALGATNFQIGQFQDYVSIRYADVLLMAAELGSGNAQDYYNQVRQRALGDAFTQKAVTVDGLRKERRLEFAFEGIRYWDLLRYGMDVATSALSMSGVEVLNGGTPTTLNITFDPATKGLQQIPYNQITLSDGVLKQNTGW